MQELPSNTPQLRTWADHYPMDALLSRWRDQGDRPRAQLVGAQDAFLCCVVADLARRLERPILIVTPDDDRARRFVDDARLFGQGEGDDYPDAALSDDVLFFPEFDVGPYHGASADRHLAMERLAALHRLSQPQPPRLMVTSARAFARRTLPPESMRAHSRVIRVEDELSNVDLRASFTAAGYLEVPVVEDPGTFAIRGDIIDLFTPGSEHPVRVERWGDEVAEIRSFHPETQRTVAELSSAEIFPVRQEILVPEAVSAARIRLLELGHEQAVATSSVQTYVADLKAGIHFIGVDAFLPALHDRLVDLSAYLPEDTVVVLVSPDESVASIEHLWEKRQGELDAVVAEGELYYGIGEHYVSPEGFVAWANGVSARLDARVVAMTAGDGELVVDPIPDDLSFSFRARPNSDVVAIRKSHHGAEQAVRALVDRLPDWEELYGRICFACRTESQVERLVRLLESYGTLPAMSLPTPIDATEPLPPPSQMIEVYHAPLAEGFRSELLGLAVIAGAEIFGDRVATQKNATREFTEQAAISHFRDLDEGDLVVHVDFGVGRYKGLVHLEVDGIGNDFLLLEYAGEDKLYLPVYRLGRVQKYLGGSEGARLDKLGGASWDRTKERVKANIREVAGELLALYARREMAKGFAFSPPDEMFREFEEKFPFEETPDQMRAINESIADMTRARPMDRLVCGDVGFGKTEVAIRAAMKAVLDGKQVAVLVPTTILAEQHLLTFRKRMDDTGVIVECLNRFRSPKETREIIARVKEGKVDVLVGTHRILNAKIKYSDLGLLIVDEEQRFGVTHKEKIKKMRTGIDCLTLSATPIPRTLQMSLMGIRDLSIIATPPHSRLAVRTHVAKFSDGIIREAIMRELGRGGQVFFVHNRVRTIDEMAEHITELVPEARVGIGHGQMNENDLEEVMLKYIKGDINLLLCTSIIESGLDIPNANTIIVNRADMFGLSQLYQLRGRVGRGAERAYAYLLIPARRTLPKDAEKRLDVIQTHTELGSGFHVASYDLEIRGAGSMLGDDQSGHVASVGLDLYNELLEEAIADIRGEDPNQDIEPEVNIPVTTYIPEDYIPATGLRLMFYKRFSLARTTDELDAVFAEMEDRFGHSPGAVRALRDVVSIKIGLRDLRAKRLDAGPSAISIELDETTTLKPEAVVKMVQESRGRLRLTGAMKIVWSLKPDESARPLESSRAMVDRLLAL